MEVGDFCRFCNTNLRIKGTLTGTRKIFDKPKPANETSINERLIALGLTLFKDPSVSFRMCRSCFRLLQRMEDYFSILRRWEKEDKDRRSPETATATAETPRSPEASGSASKRYREPTPSKTPRKSKRPRTPAGTPSHTPTTTAPADSPTTTPSRRLSKPTTGMPVRRSLLEIKEECLQRPEEADGSTMTLMISKVWSDAPSGYLHPSVCKEQVYPEQQERRARLVQGEPEPPRIQEEQEERSRY